MSFSPKLQRLLLMRRAVGLVWQSAPGWTLVSLVLLIAQGLLPLASLYLLKLIVDAVTAALKSSQPDFNQTLWLIVAMGAVTLAGAIASSLAALVNEVQAQSVTDHMASVIQAKSVQADLAYYENSHYYDTLHRAQQEAPYRPTHIVNGLVQVAAEQCRADRPRGAVAVVALDRRRGPVGCGSARHLRAPALFATTLRLAAPAHLR